MSNRPTRRQFLKTTAATGIGYWVAAGAQAKESTSANDRVQVACIGVGNKGSSDSRNASKHGDIVAVCDIDDRFLKGALKRFPKAKPYHDFRKMLDEMKDSIDAVTVTTPDHTHAAAALMAMRMGKHCFCQKPLTHSIYESRLMGQVAREQKVATMMGNQGTNMDGVRRASALIKAGALGPIKEVHVWTNRPIWAQGTERPAPAPCPKTVHWDLWLGPAPKRPYAPGYHPFAWRGWWDFGCGALGDMGCHTANMPFMALDLRDPISVQAETSGHNRDSFPQWSVITYEFAATDSRPALKLFWYDGGKLPAAELADGRMTPKDQSGCIVIGERGKIFSPNDYGASFELLGGAKDMNVKFEKSPGHFEEWFRAIKTGQPAMSNFPDYASALTETILLGNLAIWVNGEKVEWDAKNMKAKNVAGLESMIKPTYPKGYVLDV
ncbi:MAG: Gfo/Idh/MocA family oxidoreductase [Pirellulales bacterium]|nr:Gfo/Idh/MocA family oxidoreductase [Pirellulales bacterium]